MWVRWRVTCARAGPAGSKPAAMRHSLGVMPRARCFRDEPQLRRRDGGAAGERFVEIFVRSVARILLQVRVGTELVQRNRVEIEMPIRRLPSRVVALPRPEVVPTREQAEPNQIGATACLEQQLAAPLGQDG